MASCCAVDLDRATLDKYRQIFLGNESLNDMTPVVWIEGGSWPYFERTSRFTYKRRPFFAWPRHDDSSTSITTLLHQMNTAILAVSIYYVSVPNTVNISVSYAYQIMAQTPYDTVIFVEPTDVASNYAENNYFNNVLDSLARNNQTSKLPSAKFYSASDFIVYMRSRPIFYKTLLVLSYYHLNNAVMDALQEIVNVISVCVLCISTSLRRSLPESPHVKVTTYENVNDLEVAIAADRRNFSRNNTRSMVLGLNPNTNQIYPTHIVLNTETIATKIYDYGSRLEPLYHNNKVIHASRPATFNEIVNSFNLLINKSNTKCEFHYIASVRRNAYPYERLYNKINTALKSSFYLGIQISDKILRRILSCRQNRIFGDLNINNDNISSIASISSRTTSISGSLRSSISSASGVPPPNSNQLQIVSRFGDNYGVVNVPRDRVERNLGTRARTWVMDPVRLASNYSQRATSDLNSSLDALNIAFNSNSNHTNRLGSTTETVESNVRRPTEAILDHVNNIILGRICPTYDVDEYNSVLDVYNFFLYATRNRPSNKIFDAIQNYIDDFKRMLHQQN